VRQHLILVVRPYMSHGTHRKAVLNDTLPLEHRASHARSCAIHVANRLGIRREEAIKMVESITTVSLHAPENAAALIIAFNCLESL
jgi:hypothetical protein